MNDHEERTPDAPACIILYAVERTDRSRQQQLMALADRLNADGVDTEIDLYTSSPPEGWAVWMERMATERTVLVACTQLYYDRFNLADKTGAGGVSYEARIVRERLKRSKGENDDVIPFVLSPSDRCYVPIVLSDVTIYDVSTEDGYESLYARLTGRSLYAKPAVGPIRELRMPRPESAHSLNTVTEVEDSGMRAEILVALERLLSAMRRVFIHGEFPFGEWQMLHDDLDKRVRNLGARALGSTYAGLCRALDHDQFAITYCMRLNSEYEPQFEAAKSNERRYKSLVRIHDAHVMQAIAADVQTLSPFLRQLGNEELATRLDYVATTQREIAERDLGDPRYYSLGA